MYAIEQRKFLKINQANKESPDMEWESIVETTIFAAAESVYKDFVKGTPEGAFRLVNLITNETIAQHP